MCFMYKLTDIVLFFFAYLFIFIVNLLVLSSEFKTQSLKLLEQKYLKTSFRVRKGLWVIISITNNTQLELFTCLLGISCQ